MKRYRMDKWGQIPFVEPEEDDEPWSVGAGFLVLVPMTMVLVGVYLLFQYLVNR